MKVPAAAWATLMAWWCCSHASAAGMVVAPAPVLGKLTAENQLAVVSINPDHTADVRLFISIRDRSGVPHDIYLLLPLQTLPKTIRAEEATLEGFWNTEVAPTDRTRAWGAYDTYRQESAVRTAYRGGAVLAGPCASVGALVSHRRDLTIWYEASVETMSHSEKPQPATPVAVGEVEVHPSLQLDILASLTHLPELPYLVRKTVRTYAGRPFALVRLRTLGTSASQGVPTAAAAGPGVGLAFVQHMVLRDASASYVYDFPLGTDAAWKQPVQCSQVYVTAPDTANLRVEFPRRVRRSGVKWLLDRDDSPASFEVQGALERQVYTVYYSDSDLDHDAEIRWLPSGASEFAAARRTRPLRTLTTWAGFPILGLTAGLIAFLIVVRPSTVAREMGFWRALGATWLVAEIVLLVPALALLIMLGQTPGHYSQFGLTFYPITSAFIPDWRLAAMAGMFVLLGLFAALYAAVTWAVARSRPASARPLPPQRARAAIVAITAVLVSGNLRFSDVYLETSAWLFHKKVSVAVSGFIQGLVRATYGDTGDISALTGAIANAALFALVALLWLAIVRLGTGFIPVRARGLLWRGPLAALLAAIIYIPASALLAPHLLP